MLKIDNTVLVVVDVQGKLARISHQSEHIIKNIGRMIRGAQILDIPILWTEQYPKGLGATVPELAELLPDHKPLIKSHFSCCGDATFWQALTDLGRKQVMLTGIEAHVCVYQTARDLLAHNFEVEVVADAVSSRLAESKHVGLEKMKALGAAVTCVETALFELLEISGGPRFKEILKVVK